MTLDLPLRSPALYNPHLLSKEELVGLFSARQALLEELLQDLRSTPPGESAQHHLVVGQRGMGKTMLLRRLRFAVEDDPALRETWLPLSFPEEQYNVAALSDFWLNCVDALTDTLEGRGDEAAADDLDEVVEELRSVDDERERARRALDVLTGTADRLGKRLLLLVDNADLVLDRIGGEDEEWSLREVLSSQPAITFVGASAAALESAYAYGRPFYDFFRAHELSGLNEEETRTLLLGYAEAQENEEVPKLLDKDPGRLRTLHTLTGGNPRTLVLLFNIFAQGPDGDVRADLERLLDQCTPLYKARFEALPAQAQQVVDALALHWDPASAGELADLVRLPVNAVSAQLNRLVREGVVEKVPYEPASKTGFQLSERFFNIWYLMRASRRVRRRLIWLVEFLRMFYEQEELREHVRRHIRSGFKVPPEGRLRHGTSLRDLVDLDAAEPELKSRAEYLERYDSLRRTLTRAAENRRLPDDLVRRLLHAPLNLAEKESLVRELLQGDTGRLDKISSALESLERTFSRILASTDLHRTLLGALERNEMTAYDDVDGARLVEEATGIEGLVAVAAAFGALSSEDENSGTTLTASLDQSNLAFPWFVWLQKVGPSADYDEVELAIQRMADLGAGQHGKLASLATLASSLDHLERAEELYRQVLALDPEMADNWKNLAGVMERQGRLAEAEDAYRRAIEIEPKSASLWSYFGALLGEQGRLAEAEEALQTATKLGPESAAYGWAKLGGVAMTEGRFDDAEKAFHAAVDANPQLSYFWLLWAIVLEAQGLLKEAKTAYLNATQREPQDAMIWAELAGYFFRRGRSEEAMEAFDEAIELEPADVVKSSLARTLFAAGRDLSRAQTLAQEVVEKNASPEAKHVLACILMRRGRWSEAIALAATSLMAWVSEVPVVGWPGIITFFREAVAADKVREAADLLDALDLDERWRPLREALEALARGNRNYLRRVAPEVRKPAELILEELTAPREGVKDEAPGEAEESSVESPQPPQSPHKKSRAKA